MNYIIVDFEMNPVAGEHKVERKILKPQYNDSIYKKYETLTGISTQMVCGAPTFVAA